jgi:hypothetical protein
MRKGKDPEPELIRVYSSGKWVRIWEAQKHADPVLDPQPWCFGFTLLVSFLNYYYQKREVLLFYLIVHDLSSVNVKQ